jgi:hypothetical protein
MAQPLETAHAAARRDGGCRRSEPEGFTPHLRAEQEAYSNVRDAGCDSSTQRPGNYMVLRYTRTMADVMAIDETAKESVSSST